MLNCIVWVQMFNVHIFTSQPAVCSHVWTEESVLVQTPATVHQGGRACCVRSVSTKKKKKQPLQNLLTLGEPKIKYFCTHLHPSGETFCLNFFFFLLSSMWAEMFVWQSMHSSKRLRLQERIFRISVLQKGRNICTGVKNHVRFGLKMFLLACITRCHDLTVSHDKSLKQQLHVIQRKMHKLLVDIKHISLSQ